MMNIKILLLWLQLFCFSLCYGQQNELKSITEYNYNAVVLHVIESDENLFSMVPIADVPIKKSGFKLYQANANLMITDSMITYYNQSQTFVTNMVKMPNGNLSFAVTVGEIPTAIKIYTINSQLNIIDSLAIEDENLIKNRFTFANLIEGPNGDFVVNTVFYKDTMPYNVYYLINKSLILKNKFTDTTFWGEKEYNKVVTVNMLFINDEYVTLQSSPPLEQYPFNAIKRFSKNLDLLYAEKVSDQLYNERVFNSPININNKWIIANMFTHWEPGFKSYYSANLISIDSSNRITPRTLFKPEYGQVDGSANISNYGAIYDKQNQTIEVVFNSGGGYLSDYAYKLVFDTSYQLLNSQKYKYPVNKQDTIYSFINTNGCIKFKGKLFVYGYLFKSEKGKRIAIEVPRPFIEQTENLDIVLGNKEMQEQEKPIAVYPNPFSNELMIELDAKNFQLSIYDNLGRLVHFQTMESMKKINLSALPTGMYFLQVRTQNGEIHSEKLIKTE